MMLTKTYIAIAEREAGETGWSLFFPDFPHASSAPDRQSIPLQAHDALLTMIEDEINEGRPVPEPSFPEQLPPDAGKERIYILVPVEIPSSPVRVNISIDKGLLQRIDANAERLGMSRSGFLAESARRMIQAQ